jgi:hypothetical protein
MERFNRLPRAVVLGAFEVLLAVGIVAPAPWGGLAFLLVSASIGWLLFLTWPRLTQPERLLRLAVLALTVAVTIVKLVPQG